MGVTGTIRAGRALRNSAAPSTWTQLARLINFVGYDTGQRRRIALGNGVRMGPTVSIRNGTNIAIGDGAHIGQGSFLWAGDPLGRIDLGDHALLAPGVFITASDYDFDLGLGPVMDLPRRAADVRVGANTWLGARVIVVAGVTIGDGAIVAAGSVVSRDLPANCVAAGVPARVIRHRGEPRA